MSKTLNFVMLGDFIYFSKYIKKSTKNLSCDIFVKKVCSTILFLSLLLFRFRSLLFAQKLYLTGGNVLCKIKPFNS